MTQNIRVKTDTKRNKVGNKKNRNSLIRSSKSYIAISNGLGNNKPTLEFFNNPNKIEEIKKYDELEDQIFHEEAIQYNPEYWIERDNKFFLNLLHTSVEDKSLFKNIGQLHSFIKHQHSKDKILMFAAEALLRLDSVKTGLKENDAQYVFINMQRVSQFKQLILIAENDIAISLYREKLKKLPKTSSISSNEKEKIKRVITRFYKEDSKLNHGTIILKAIEELYENGDLPNEYIDDNGNKQERKKPFSEECNRSQLANTLARRLQKRDFKKS